jgi:hypothetical protein
MTQHTNVRLGWIKGMYLYTVIGAGGFGLMMLFAPNLVDSIFGISVCDPMIYGVAASIWLAFGILSLLGLRSPLKFLPVLLIQCIYKSIWVIGVLLPLVFKNELPNYAPLMIVVMVSYIIGDLIAIPFHVILKKGENDSYR